MLPDRGVIYGEASIEAHISQLITHHRGHFLSSPSMVSSVAGADWWRVDLGEDRQRNVQGTEVGELHLVQRSKQKAPVAIYPHENGGELGNHHERCRSNRIPVVPAPEHDVFLFDGVIDALLPPPGMGVGMYHHRPIGHTKSPGYPAEWSRWRCQFSR